MAKSKMKELSQGAGKRARKASTKTGSIFEKLMEQSGKKAEKLYGPKVLNVYKKRVRA